MKRLFALLLSLMICCPPCLAKAVSLDVYELDPATMKTSHPSPEMKPYYKPFFVEMRHRIEDNWSITDPAVGRSIEVLFLVDRTGKVTEMMPKPLDRPPDKFDQVVAAAAASTIMKSSPFQALPHMRSEEMAVMAKFKSRYPRTEINSDQVMNAVIAAGLAAAIGFGIWALIKYGGNTSSAPSGYTNPNWHWVHRRDGTVFIQTNPNDTMYDNFSTKGNTNWNTGQPGTVVPYR